MGPIPSSWNTDGLLLATVSCKRRLQRRMQHDSWHQVTKATLLPPGSLSRDTCSWNPAVMLWGNPGHMERPHVSIPANGSSWVPSEQAASAARHVDEEVIVWLQLCKRLKEGPCCSSQATPRVLSESHKWLLLFCITKFEGDLLCSIKRSFVCMYLSITVLEPWCMYYFPSSFF